MGRTDKALALTNELINLGKSVNVIADELASMMNNILYAKNCQDAKDVLSLPSELFMKIKETTLSADSSKLYRAAEIFASIQNSLRYSSLPKVVLETAVAKACDVASSFDEVSILRRVTDLEAFKRSFQGSATEAGTTVSAQKVWGDILGAMTSDKDFMHYERVICERVLTDKTSTMEIVNKEFWISSKDRRIVDELNKYKTPIQRQIQAKYPEIQSLKITLEVAPLDQTIQTLGSMFEEKK